MPDLCPVLFTDGEIVEQFAGTFDEIAGYIAGAVAGAVAGVQRPAAIAAASPRPNAVSRVPAETTTTIPASQAAMAA